MELYYIAIIAFVITIISGIYIKVTYNSQKVTNSKKLSGCEIAQKLLEENNINNVYVLETKGALTDHYDSEAKVIRLSTEVFHGETVSAASVAAHEAGHAIQYKEGNKFIKVRSIIFPFVNFSSRFGYIAVLLGLIFSIAEFIYVGAILFTVLVLFQLFTLPVEFDASKKALANLQNLNLLTSEEMHGAKKVLKSAAFTYIAALATTILELLRLLMVANNRRK